MPTASEILADALADGPLTAYDAIAVASALVGVLVSHSLITAAAGAVLLAEITTMVLS